MAYDTDEYEPSPDELEAAGGEEEEAAAPEEEEEEEEGQVKLPTIYDSGEEEVGLHTILNNEYPSHRVFARVWTGFL